MRKAEYNPVRHSHQLVLISSCFTVFSGLCIGFGERHGWIGKSRAMLLAGILVVSHEPLVFEAVACLVCV